MCIVMRERTEQALTEFRKCKIWMFELVTGLRIDGKEVDEEKCMRGSDGKQCFCEKEKGNVWKDYMQKIMNEENEWNCNVCKEMQ